MRFEIRPRLRFDGSRQPLTAGVDTLVTIRDGNRRQVYRDFTTSPSLWLTDLPFFNNFLEHRAAVLACLFSLTTAMGQIHLPLEMPMEYIKELSWDELAQDRFFAWVDPALVEQVRRAAAQGVFAPEIDTALFHAGATCSFKQVQLGEANVQLTFHENDK